MYLSLFVIYVLLVTVGAKPIAVSECGILETPFTTYKLAQDVVVQNSSFGYICFDIRGEGITLDGNGFELSSASNRMLSATGVQYTGASSVVTNMRITNMRTGIYAKGKYGQIINNTITRAANGIDVTATNNQILHNTISQFEAFESTAGIYVYFPAVMPVYSFINITHNVISDIQGDSFALGISVYYATGVYIAHNTIFNLQAGISSQEISAINGRVELFDNSFEAPVTEGPYTLLITLLASAFVLVASFIFFQASTVSVSPPSPSHQNLSQPIRDTNEIQNKEKEIEKQDKERDKEEFELDGADVRRVRTMSFHLGSSPNVR